MELTTPLTKEKIKSLKAGDTVTISGIIYTGRDAAHKRMCETLEKGEELPFDIKNQVIYHVGPCPCREGEIIGSCGPTTSGRMDKYSPMLIKKGLCAMIGKGERNQEVVDAIKENCGVYFGAIGGAGALLSSHVVKSEVIAYDDLGTEAIRCLEVDKFPVTVIIDSYGNNLYKTGREQFKK